MLKFRSSVESTSRFTKLNSLDMFQKCFFSVIWFGLAFLVLTVRPMQTSSPDLKVKKRNVDVIQKGREFSSFTSVKQKHWSTFSEPRAASLRQEEFGTDLQHDFKRHGGGCC